MTQAPTPGRGSIVGTPRWVTVLAIVVVLLVLLVVVVTLTGSHSPGVHAP